MSRRTDKVASIVRDVVSQAIITKLSDPRISSFASITRVEVSGDVMHATVYVSVMGTESDERLTMAGLRHARGYLQSLLAGALTTRHCPQLRFVADRGIKKQMKTLELIDRISAELRQAEATRPSGSDGEVPAGSDPVSGEPVESDDQAPPAGEGP